MVEATAEVATKRRFQRRESDPRPGRYEPQNHVRFVTATSLFDGHDASINIFRRMLQSGGAEVIHLGHNRSVHEIVQAALEEDAQGVAVSCYQGGHIEFFKYTVDLLKEAGAAHVRVFGGGGGVIIQEEIEELQAYGVERIYSPEDGRRLGLPGIVTDMIRRCDFVPPLHRLNGHGLAPESKAEIACAITAVELAREKENEELAALREKFRAQARERRVPVLGITGTGGAGKSSLTDELVRRFLMDQPQGHVAVVSVDPTKRKSGGALLGDRIRMNSLDSPRVYMRSMATRSSGSEVAECLEEVIGVVKAAGFDLVIVETAGIGQGNSAIVNMVDATLYVMTAEYGAASQLEKIDMLDFADLVAINKFDKKGSRDALRDVRKQVQRNHEVFDRSPEEMPVYGTIASKFNDDGVTALYRAVLDVISRKSGVAFESRLPAPETKESSSTTIIIPPERTRYLSEISKAVREHHRRAEEQAALAGRAQKIRELLDEIRRDGGKSAVEADLAEILTSTEARLEGESQRLLDAWPKLRENYLREECVFKVRNKEVRVPTKRRSLSGLDVPKVALPPFKDEGEILRWLLLENVPGEFPYTAGVFPFKRVGEDPTRMFAGEGDPFRTNRRFHYLSRDSEAKRLSTAFDSVTLYGQDPAERPDIYGKVGNSGVSICTLEDMKVLYSGFDLCAPNNSVSMTINGPAPAMLAFFFNTAVDQQAEKFEKEHKRRPTEEERKRIKAETLSTVRGTVQADILKEDQGQNTCIFSTDFALKMMGDIQQYFVQHNVRNFYSVSISGYHIAEAGANPISQLAFTLANGFTYVEYYLSRGMKIDDFAPNLSFFFSNGMEPEYTVIGRVARRIWAIAMRDLYGGNDRSQKLKYHIQTSGRSLHVQEMDFNDIRTTLQALCAIYDNCNSLHTNSFDEAVTTPTEESVRRALAIQLIINREWGLAKNENPNQGAFIVEELTRLVEEAVLLEFDRISERGGVLGAMELGYQRGKIQEESLFYEHQKHTGEYPIVGVNIFLNPRAQEGEVECAPPELARATEEEKQSQLDRLRKFHGANAERAPFMLERLKKTALEGGNIFEQMMETARYCSLGQISRALHDVGGSYRRNM